MLLVVSALALGLAVLPASAQNTSIYNGHMLGPAPSVTSLGGIGASPVPPPLPSVTSLPNFTFQHPFAHHRLQNRYTHFNGGYFGGYPIAYYYPIDNSAYGYDYVGSGPDMYSGPPPGPNDPVLHMIVEQPPAGLYGPNRYGPPPEAPPPVAAQPASPAPEVKAGEPTVLVFRSGKQQEVTNYAIMGDTLYVFDKGKIKIAMADLDIPATIKANDDRGLEFRVPPSPRKNAITTPVPDTTKESQPPNIAAVLPSAK